MSIMGVSGNEEDMSPEASEDFRKMMGGWLRGARVHSAAYNFERKEMENGHIKVFAEIIMEVSDD